MTMPNIDSIPSELKNMNRWCLWRKIKRDNGKVGKVPYLPDGKPMRIDVDEPISYASALQALASGNFDGIGILLGNGLCGIDIDDCLTSETSQINHFAFTFISRFDGYAEHSPSGTGVHILFKTDPAFEPDVKRQGKVEIYSDKRFFTVTGKRIRNEDKPLRNITPNQIRELWLKCMGEPNPRQATKSPQKPIAMPTNSNNTEMTVAKIEQLCQKDGVLNQLWQGKYNDETQHSADFRLCLKLAFYTGGNAALMYELFQSSGLMRDKWTSKRGNTTYGMLTVENALKEWDGQAYQINVPAVAGDVVKNTVESTGGGIDSTAAKTKLFLPPQSKLGELLAKQLTNLAFDAIREDWMLYQDYHWQRINQRDAMKIINTEVTNSVGDVGYSKSFLNGVAGFIEMLRSFDKWNIETDCIPFKNGLLSLKTRALTPHKREHRTTWLIPYDYTPDTDCTPIIEWLTHCVGGHQDQVQLLRAYMAAILRGKAELQRYLEIIGPGGTGKGTFIRLCELIIGEQNCHSTELKHLENNRFETANLYGKRLITITDSQNYAGDVSVLKAMTGQDTLRYEEKNKQGGQGFKLQAMIVIAANEPIASKDYTSGIARRRITIAFNTLIKSTERRDLINEFQPMLPALINWILDIPVATITTLVRDTSISVPSLKDTERDNLLATNPIAQWLDECIAYEPDNKIGIGVIQRQNGEILDKFTKIYPSYINYCEGVGFKPLSLVRFVLLLEELCKSQLQLNVTRERTRTGSFFIGLDVKRDIDDDRQSPLDAKYKNHHKPVTPVTALEECGLNPSH